jgi:hypothetical protein
VARFPWWSEKVPRGPMVIDPLPDGIQQAVAERAHGLLPDFEAFLAVCAAAADPGSGVGREGHRLATEFDHLVAWLQDDPAPVSADRELLESGLRYHRAMIHDALRFTFPRCRTEQTEALRRSLGSDRGPTERLRDHCARFDRET